MFILRSHQLLIIYGFWSYRTFILKALWGYFASFQHKDSPTLLSFVSYTRLHFPFVKILDSNFPWNFEISKFPSVIYLSTPCMGHWYHLPHLLFSISPTLNFPNEMVAGVEIRHVSQEYQGKQRVWDLEDWQGWGKNIGDYLGNSEWFSLELIQELYLYYFHFLEIWSMVWEMGFILADVLGEK